MHDLSTPQSSLLATTNQSVALCVPPYETDRLPLVFLYSVVLIIGLPANLLTVYLTWMQVRSNNVLGVYLLSLSVCDLMYLCTLPLWAFYVSRGHWWPWSSAACKVCGYIFFNNMYISIFLLCCVSADRYVAVVYVMESRGRGLRRRRVAAAVTAAIVAVVAVGHVPVFSMEEGEGAEGQRRCFEPNQTTARVTGFNLARFAMGFLAPLVLLIATNRAILSSVRASVGLSVRHKARVRSLALGVVLLFLVCFGPYHLVLLLRALLYYFPQLLGQDEECRLEKRIYTAYTISLGLSTFNSAINPLLYVLSSENIRKELTRGLAAMLGPAGTSSSRGEGPHCSTDANHSKISTDTAAYAKANSVATNATRSTIQRSPACSGETVTLTVAKSLPFVQGSGCDFSQLGV